MKKVIGAISMLLPLLAGCAGLQVLNEPATLPVITVGAVNGPAELRSAGTAPARVLAAGTTLDSGAILSGLTDSTTIDIIFTPGGRTTLRGEGELTVAFGIDTIRNSQFISMFLDGGLLSLRAEPSRDRRLEVRTVAATAGVRGTAFDLYAGRDGATELYVDTGLVEFTDNQTGEELEVGAGEAAEDMIDRSPARRQFLAWYERNRWTPQFVRERRERLRRQVEEEFRQLDGKMATYLAAGEMLADSVLQVHRARAAAHRDGFGNDTHASFGAWVGYLHDLKVEELRLYGEIVKLNHQMHWYRSRFEELAELASLTREQQARLARMSDQVSFAIDNNRRLFFMGDPIRQFFLGIGDFLHPGDEDEYYRPVQ